MAMLRLVPIAVLVALTACSSARPGLEPSLAPRAAEAIDPRIPVPGDVPPGPVDASLASTLSALVRDARATTGPFEAQRASAARLAAAAGAPQSESWIAAEQSVSELTRTHGQVTRIAADIDSLAAVRSGNLTAADQQAIREAASTVGEINAAQASAIAQISARLGR